MQQPLGYRLPMPPLRVAILGAGFMGKMHANVYKTIPGAELVAIFDKSDSRAQEFGSQHGLKPYTDFDEMLQTEELDVIDICLPTHLHKEFGVKAALAGKHLMCEKPMAMSLQEADEMIAAVDKTGVHFMIGHCIRFWPEYALLKEIVVDKRLGKLISLNLTRLGQFPSWSADNWLADESLSGGGVLDMHIHDTDYALYLLGWPKSMVSYGNIDATGPAYAFTTLSYGDTIVHLEGGWNLPKGTPFRMTFRAVFENGAVFWENGPLTIYENGKEPVSPTFEKMEGEGGGNISDLGGYYHELAYFIDKVSKKLPVEIVTPGSSRESLKLVLAEIDQIKAQL